MSDEQKIVDVPEKFRALVQEIEKMSVLDLSELVKVLEKKFGVSAQAPQMAAASAATGAAPQAQQEEQTEFALELVEAGANKIAVIKVIKEVTGLGLADAKALVDGAPKQVKAGLKKADAEAMKKKIEDAGGKVALK